MKLRSQMSDIIHIDWPVSNKESLVNKLKLLKEKEKTINQDS